MHTTPTTTPALADAATVVVLAAAFLVLVGFPALVSRLARARVVRAAARSRILARLDQAIADADRYAPVLQAPLSRFEAIYRCVSCRRTVRTDDPAALMDARCAECSPARAAADTTAVQS